MDQHIISRIAIWLLAAVMIVFGIQHFKHPENMLVYVPPYLPGGIVWVYVFGVAFILAGLAFIVNQFVSLAGYLLVALLSIFVVAVHWPNYKDSGNAELRQMALVSLLKDTTIAAFAMYVAVNAKHQRLNTDD